MVDCVVRFERRQEDRVSVHKLQITKYRGSGYAAAEFPLSFGPSGIEVGATEPRSIGHEASTRAGHRRLRAARRHARRRRVSRQQHADHGRARHLQDHAGGQVREAACRRGERTLFVSFDESADQIVRNLSSVGIQLKAHVKSGLLRMYSARTEGISAEEQLIKLRVADPRVSTAVAW